MSARYRTNKIDIPRTIEPKRQAVTSRKSSSPRKRKEQLRAIESRERILAAAIAEFAKHGYEGASTREVARQADVRHPLITYHFEGKEGLWQAVMDKLAKSFVARQFERLEELQSFDEVTQLRSLFEAFARHSAVDQNLHKIMTHVADSSTQLDSLVESWLAPYFAMIANLIAAAQKAGAFVEGDPHHLHYLFIGATTRIFMQAAEAEKIMGISPVDPAFVDQHVHACLKLFFKDQK